MTRYVLDQELRGLGAEVLHADDGSAALQVLTSEILTLDLLVTDLAMPVMDGLTLVRVVRAEGGEQDLAILVACESPPPDAEARLRSLHASVVDRKAGTAAVAAEARSLLELQGWNPAASEPWPAAVTPDAVALPRRLSAPAR